MLDQRVGQLLGRGREDNAVERSFLGPAQIAVADTDVNVRVALLGECPPRLYPKFLDDFDGVNLARQFRQHRRLITGPGSDLQHFVAWLQIELLGHESDYVRL